ncbi:metal ABC transporter solute-binding protein, Zn/Mn family [Bifidobacterium crudilactis]|uniref:Zinc ABC transporter solute-binding protein n=3 Tax=Bifidobacterium crudilactis TaxID=327277 RepID=A0A971IDI4_9BIFI|nr:zinc ABC transporter substrate-binding protein [Bifidobacterium crudilactis]MCI1868144.1 zinc ABC transporter substrate-binding protein [Bifidobacterium crudilactis]MDN5972559.1 zinc ABC transporter substrate-binding protein [Bifidobacterium crudilactis]MDN6000761.1 zinc ABC transporter substrate-binding protein [Bifidobacterium crudilactis]MDN6210175.1 zinc ABC transporter substrate-binding protein [Bifidobacterium crudilactis]MDN6425020.1 zinc ABC transporter substrate-binding protein [Bi
MKRILAASVAIAALAGVSACGSSANEASSSDASSDSKISVIASINQWGSVARDLGGDKVNVTSIMTNTNVEAHDYEPSTSDVAKFTSAKVVVVNGADYDPWATKAASSTKATLVDAAEAGGKKSGDNPHVWFSAAVRTAAADAITKAYEKAMPDQKTYFAGLNTEWKAKEQKLEATIKESSTKLKGVNYAATESVAWYLADDLGMKDVTPSGYAQASANESEPSPADITAYQQALGTGDIKMLVFNSQEADSVTDQITSAAKKNNVPIVDLTEQMPKQYNDLLDWMNALVSDFAKSVE